MRLTRTLLCAALLAATTAVANASELIDVQVSNNTKYTQTGAAATGSAGDTWNNLTSGQQGSGSLVDTTGAASGVSLSFSANNFWEADPSYYQFANTSLADLMQGYLVGYGGQSDITLTFTGLVAGQEYGFWVYTQGDDNSNGRSIDVTANGSSATATQNNIGSLIQGDNYVYLTTFADSTGTVELLGHDLNGEANINGVQITAVPEPSEMALLMAGLGLVGGVALRKKRGR